MAYTKILVIHNRLDKSLDYAMNEEKTSLSAAIDYALNRDKNETTCFETAINCELDAAYSDMMETKRRWGKESKAHIQGYHIIQSFPPGEVTPEEAHTVGVEFASRLLGNKYEVIVTTHLNKAHLHCHIVFNSVSFMDGKMYRNNFRDYFGGDGVGIRGTSDAVCREHGLSVIEPSDSKGKQYSEWQAEKQGKPTVRELIRRDIDNVLAQSFTYKSFLEGMERMGYSIKSGPNVKHTAIRPAWGEKNIRLDSLGDGYTTEGIKARLASVRSGEALPTSPKPPKQEPSPWRIPGRRYTVQGGLTHHSQKLRGFRALYFKYLYLLGIVRSSRPRTRAAFVLRQDLIQFDRYKQQFLYLMKNRIETVGQLSMQYDALQSEIDALTDRRADLYKQQRRYGNSDAATAEIISITERLRVLRRELKLCVRIEGDIPKVQRRVQDVWDTEERNRQKALEKTKQRPAPDIGAR